MSTLDIAVFERIEAGQFKLISKSPLWLSSVLLKSEIEAPSFRLQERSAFIDFFLEDAEPHWGSGSSEPMQSDEWIETGRFKEELALSATALSEGQHKLLLIQHVGHNYRRKQAEFQNARETLLTRDLLEEEVRKRTQQIRQREEEISMRLLAAAVKRDQETGAHVRRIGLYAAEMGSALGWEPSRIDDIRIAAPMHDIGKIGIPDSILLKPGRLDPEEFAIMQRHAQIGADMLDGTDIPMLEMACEIALYHHERWDGTGYPHGLAGTAIPENARITSICDVYDALSNKRVYKPAFSDEDTQRMLREQSGKHFDPDLLEVFFSILPAITAIAHEVREEEDDEFDFQQLTGTFG